MTIQMQCPDCKGEGYFDTGDDLENCILCGGNGNLTIDVTPGAWHILEVQPARGLDKPGGLYWQAPEGHMGVYSDGADEACFEILSTTLHMERVYGSGDGGLIARIPMAHGPAGRAQALVNARAIVEAAR